MKKKTMRQNPIVNAAAYGVVRIPGPPREVAAINAKLRVVAENYNVRGSEVALHILSQWAKGNVVVPAIQKEVRL